MRDCKAAGFPFQVLVDDEFEMGDANGNWGYLEEPDGTLIEFVKTLKVPLVKKIGWTINMKKRNPTKPLPSWLIIVSYTHLTLPKKRIVQNPMIDH